MALTNAQKQRRWRERSVLLLSADAREIARRLAAMDDQTKLARIVYLLNKRHKPTDGRCKWSRKQGRPRIGEVRDQPWLALGMSRRTWYRRQAEERK
jgi:hypothetical protein